MVTEPESMDQLVYMTQRKIGDGFVKAWDYRNDCPKCGKAKMGKPRDEKTGKVKIRAKEYQCPECKYTVDKQEYEETLTAEIKYTCPKCKKDQFITSEQYKQDIICKYCGANIPAKK